MSGWDWLHAGLEVATYAQARKAQQRLDSMQTAAEIDAGRKALIEAMRNFIFDISRDIQLAGENTQKFPQQVFIIAKTLESRLKDSGLSPEVFPEFSDKEYVHNTYKKVDQVLSESQLLLNEDQIDQSKFAVNYLIEMPLLHDAIRAKSSKEQILATQDEWKKIESSKNSAKTKRILGFVGLPASWCLCFVMGLSSGNNSSGALILPILVLIGAIVLIAGSNPNSSRYNELKALRENWQKDLLSADEWNHIVNRFGGDLPSNQFQELLEQRIAFLNPILGNEFQNFLTESN